MTPTCDYQYQLDDVGGHLVVIAVVSDNSHFVFQLSVAQWVMAIVSATSLIFFMTTFIKLL